jgi:hypothetical protein
LESWSRYWRRKITLLQVPLSQSPTTTTCCEGSNLDTQAQFSYTPFEQKGVLIRLYSFRAKGSSYQGRKAKLVWLWVLAISLVALFLIHPNLSKAAFEALIQAWVGVLIADGYGVYRNWAGKRQACLAHLIREAKGLAERKDPAMAKCGAWARDELQRLCHMAKAPPTVGEWRAFFARFKRMLSIYGDRWVERILSLRQTCRIQDRRTFPVLVEAMSAAFHDRHPDVGWIRALGATP